MLYLYLLKKQPITVKKNFLKKKIFTITDVPENGDSYNLRFDQDLKIFLLNCFKELNYAALD